MRKTIYLKSLKLFHFKFDFNKKKAIVSFIIKFNNLKFYHHIESLPLLLQKYFMKNR